MLIGAFPVQPVYTVLATVGIILAALYVLLVYQRTMHGPPHRRAARGRPGLGRGRRRHPRAGRRVGAPRHRRDGYARRARRRYGHPAAAPAGAARAPRLRIRDLSRRELAVVTPLVAIIIATGVYPQPLLDLIRPAVAATMSDVGANPDGVTPVHATASPGGK